MLERTVYPRRNRGWKSFRRMTMRTPIVRGAAILSFFSSLVAAECLAQGAGRAAVSPYQSAPAPRPGMTSRLNYPYAPDAGTRAAYARQEPTTTAPATPSPTTPPVEPFGPSGSGAPANATDVALPKAERAEGGGEPT